MKVSLAARRRRAGLIRIKFIPASEKVSWPGIARAVKREKYPKNGL
jgi:hypothetical protein